jgi:hypothetical protein
MVVPYGNDGDDVSGGETKIRIRKKKERKRGCCQGWGMEGGDE